HPWSSTRLVFAGSALKKMALCTSIRTRPDLRPAPPLAPRAAPSLLTWSCNSSSNVTGEGAKTGATETLRCSRSLFALDPHHDADWKRDDKIWHWHNMS